jgi:dUTPase
MNNLETIVFYGNDIASFKDALQVRYEVFTLEQGYDAMIDEDIRDGFSWHVVCYDDKHFPIATARLYSDYQAKAYGVGRVCVRKEYRRRDIGALLMEILIDKAISLNLFRDLIIHAQTHAIPFYDKLNFVTIGEEFLEEGQPHVSMKLQLHYRGFEVANGFEHMPVVIPVRKTSGSAGYDITLIEKVIIPPKATLLVKTGLKAYMQSDEVLEMFIRSSIALKHNVWCTNNVGVIDSDYYANADNDGHIMIPLYNANDVEKTFEAGERICQAIFKKYFTVDGENFAELGKRTGGFGSTGV